MRVLVFQFLIGTIKTATFHAESSRLSPSVSIPHRYDQNNRRHRCSVCGKPVSIPHRYDQNCVPQEFKPAKWRVSIPHRYDQNSNRFISSLPAA